VIDVVLKASFFYNEDTSGLVSSYAPLEFPTKLPAVPLQKQFITIDHPSDGVFAVMVRSVRFHAAG
jgi:hypothetical protein